MAFDDLTDGDTTDLGDEALDELAGTLAGDNTDKTDTTRKESDNTTAAENTVAFDPQSEPVFPTTKSRTLHSMYCLPET